MKGRFVMASITEDSATRLWDIPSGRLIAILPGHTDKVTYLALLEDGRLCSSSMDKTVVITKIFINQ